MPTFPQDALQTALQRQTGAAQGQRRQQQGGAGQARGVRQQVQQANQTRQPQGGGLGLPPVRQQQSISTTQQPVQNKSAPQSPARPGVAGSSVSGTPPPAAPVGSPSPRTTTQPSNQQSSQPAPAQRQNTTAGIQSQIDQLSAQYQRDGATMRALQKVNDGTNSPEYQAAVQRYADYGAKMQGLQSQLSQSGIQDVLAGIQQQPSPQMWATGSTTQNATDPLRPDGLYQGATSGTGQVPELPAFETKNGWAVVNGTILTKQDVLKSLSPEQWESAVREYNGQLSSQYGSNANPIDYSQSNIPADFAQYLQQNISQLNSASTSTTKQEQAAFDSYYNATGPISTASGAITDNRYNLLIDKMSQMQQSGQQVDPALLNALKSGQVSESQYTAFMGSGSTQQQGGYTPPVYTGPGQVFTGGTGTTAPKPSPQMGATGSTTQNATDPLRPDGLYQGQQQPTFGTSNGESPVLRILSGGDYTWVDPVTNQPISNLGPGGQVMSTDGAFTWTGSRWIPAGTTWSPYADSLGGVTSTFLPDGYVDPLQESLNADIALWNKRLQDINNKLSLMSPSEQQQVDPSFFDTLYTTGQVSEAQYNAFMGSGSTQQQGGYTPPDYTGPGQVFTGGSGSTTPTGTSVPTGSTTAPTGSYVGAGNVAPYSGDSQQSLAAFQRQNPGVDFRDPAVMAALTQFQETYQPTQVETDAYVRSGGNQWSDGSNTWAADQQAAPQFTPQNTARDDALLQSFYSGQISLDELNRQLQSRQSSQPISTSSVSMATAPSSVSSPSTIQQPRSSTQQMGMTTGISLPSPTSAGAQPLPSQPVAPSGVTASVPTSSPSPTVAPTQTSPTPYPAQTSGGQQIGMTAEGGSNTYQTSLIQSQIDSLNAQYQADSRTMQQAQLVENGTNTPEYAAAVERYAAYPTQLSSLQSAMTTPSTQVQTGYTGSSTVTGGFDDSGGYTGLGRDGGAGAGSTTGGTQTSSGSSGSTTGSTGGTWTTGGTSGSNTSGSGYGSTNGWDTSGASSTSAAPTTVSSETWDADAYQRLYEALQSQIQTNDMPETWGQNLSKLYADNDTAALKTIPRETWDKVKSGMNTQVNTPISIQDRIGTSGQAAPDVTTPRWDDVFQNYQAEDAASLFQNLNPYTNQAQQGLQDSLTSQLQYGMTGAPEAMYQNLYSQATADLDWQADRARQEWAAENARRFGAGGSSAPGISTPMEQQRGDVERAIMGEYAKAGLSAAEGAAKFGQQYTTMAGDELSKQRTYGLDKTTQQASNLQAQAQNRLQALLAQQQRISGETGQQIDIAKLREQAWQETLSDQLSRETARQQVATDTSQLSEQARQFNAEQQRQFAALGSQLGLGTMGELTTRGTEEYGSEVNRFNARQNNQDALMAAMAMAVTRSNEGSGTDVNVNTGTTSSTGSTAVSYTNPEIPPPGATIYTSGARPGISGQVAYWSGSQWVDAATDRPWGT